MIFLLILFFSIERKGTLMCYAFLDLFVGNERISFLLREIQRKEVRDGGKGP